MAGPSGKNLQIPYINIELWTRFTIHAHTPHTNWYFWFTLPFPVLPICSRWLTLIQLPPSCRVKSVRLDFYLPANKIKHLFVCHARKEPTLRTHHVGQRANPAPVAIATNLNRSHAHQLQMSNVKNAANVLQAFGR